MFQRKRKPNLIINRGVNKTVICLNILINHIGDNCKILIKGNGDNLMI